MQEFRATGATLMRYSLLGLLSVVVLIAVGSVNGSYHCEPSPCGGDDPTADWGYGLGHSLAEVKALPDDTKAITPRWFSDDDMHHLKRFTSLTSLDLRYSLDVSDDALKVVSNLNTLEDVNLERPERRTEFSDSGLAQLGKLSHLRSVTLDWNANVGRETCAALSALKQLETVSLAWTGVSDDDVRSVIRCEAIRSLSLTGCRKLTATVMGEISLARPLEAISIAHVPALTSSNLVAFASMPALKSLDVTRSGTEPTAVEFGDRPSKLEAIALGECKCVSKAIIECLVGLPQLKSISLDGIESVDDAILRRLLSCCAGIEKVSLQDCKAITSDGLSGIEHSKEMRWLDVSRTKVGSAACRHIAKCSQLSHLYMYDCATMDDAGVAELRPLGELVELVVESAKVTDASIPVLQRFTKLTLLIVGSGISTDGIKLLSKALPNCEVYVRPIR
ncbi:MAG: hypothetical protein IPK87_06080 [Planctomycetes bacterium]|nr:hypothetical protein [Planctomycetota bacterium]